MNAAMPYLPSGAKRYMYVYMVLSSLLALLDIAALMILGLSMTSMMQGNPVNIPIIGEFPPDRYVVLLAFVSGLILVRSFLSLTQQWFATRKFATFELALGTELFDAYLRAPWLERLSRTTSQLVRMADVGVAAINAGLILPLMQLPAMIVSAITIVVTLFIVQPVTAIITLVYLGLIAVLLQFVLGRRTVQAGKVNRNYSFKVASLMTDMVGAFKEVTLRDKVGEVAQVVENNRAHATRARANMQFLASVPKFVLDSALIGGFLVVGLGSYLIDGSLDAAIGAVVMFAVAGLRLVPALTGFQSTVNQLNASQSQVEAVLFDIEDAKRYRAAATELGNEPLAGHPTSVRLENVTFTYPTRQQPALANVSLEIPFGSTAGLVGESGSGKSTLVDMLLGLFMPQEGDIFIGKQRLEDVMKSWRARVGYVPQEVSLFDGSIEQNVALTWSGDIDRDKVIECLKKAQLWETVKNREGGLTARIGERGMAFSGGQRQRLGIARALYSDPLVLILDEATSALDTKTEAEVAKAVHALRGEVTVISVAHRLSTVKDSDQLFYLEDGHLLATGTFDEVVGEVPTFAQQARLAGLLGDSK